MHKSKDARNFIKVILNKNKRASHTRHEIRPCELIRHQGWTNLRSSSKVTGATNAPDLRTYAKFFASSPVNVR